MISGVCSVRTCHLLFRKLSLRLYCGCAMSTKLKELIKQHVGFIGSGQMAQAMAKGFLSSGVLKGSQITMTDIFDVKSGSQLPEHIVRIQTGFGVEYLSENNVMASKSDIIFACVKPNIILPVLSQIDRKHLADKLVISIAAGTTIDQIQKVLPETTRLVRVMPNTPCLVQAGTAVYATGENVRSSDEETLKTLCSGIFKVFEKVPEKMINAVSGISGCGPAYIFMVGEALADGGVRMGVPRDLAHKLAVSMIAGAAEMMEKTNENPAKLKNDVCSPGGATIAAVHALEEGGVRAAFINAVRAACLRSEELND